MTTFYFNLNHFWILHPPSAKLTRLQHDKNTEYVRHEQIFPRSQLKLYEIWNPNLETEKDFVICQSSEVSDGDNGLSDVWAVSTKVEDCPSTEWVQCFVTKRPFCCIAAVAEIIMPCGNQHSPPLQQTFLAIGAAATSEFAAWQGFSPWYTWGRRWNVKFSSSSSGNCYYEKHKHDLE